MKKNFVTGFIAGGIICAAVTGFAVEYAVTANPYPVKVNGIETTIQGYNINDETYFKLRDISAAVGGFEVGFENNAIIVNTPNKPTPTPTSADITIVKGEDGNDYTSDGLKIEYIDDIAYINSLKITDIYDIFFIGDNCIYDKNKNKIELAIPTHPKYSQYIPLEFYKNTLVTFILNITE
jgi:hypothetical protein